MYGGTGEDAMIGDRGGVLDTALGDPGHVRAAQYTFNSNGPPFVIYTGFRPGTFDRRVDLTQGVPVRSAARSWAAVATLTSNG